MADRDFQAGDKVWVFHPTKATSIGASIDLVHEGGHRVDVTIERPGHELDGSKTSLPVDAIWKKQEPGDKC